MMFSKAHIISEIKRTAKDNNGSPLGKARFERETGIRTSDWEGKYWARWGDALRDAGFEPNVLQGPRDEKDLLDSLASLTRQLGHFPVRNEMKLWCRGNPGFPSHNTFRRFGKKKDQLERLIAHSKEQGYTDVVEICKMELSQVTEKQPKADSFDVGRTEQAVGYVYLLKSGKYYKIGRTVDLGRREYELGIQLPERPVRIHSIKTDDPVGIERYWHERFKDRRRNGEWFTLTKEDVRAFKRRKFM